MNNQIASEFPFKSNYIKVNDSQIHYIDENRSSGRGQTTFLLLHGNPSSSYLWRNIIPYLLPYGRVVAPDLIGFGKSDKPYIDYRVPTHGLYIEEFIRILNLKNLVLVLHDWGAAIGLTYARNHEANIKGIAFMEGIVKPLKWDFADPFGRLIFRAFRTPKVGDWLNIQNNFFVKRILLFLGTKRKLTKAEKAYYSEPFRTKKSRKPVHVFPNEIPINGKPKDVHDIVLKNHEWLKISNVPKLLLWVKPGVLIKPWHVKEMQYRYPQLHVKLLGDSSKFPLRESHYVQEDFPHEIGSSVVNWYRSISGNGGYTPGSPESTDISAVKEASEPTRPVYWKQVIATIFTVYPLLLTAQWIIDGLFSAERLVPQVAIFLMVSIVVPLMVFPMMPLTMRILGSWPYKK